MEKFTAWMEEHFVPVAAKIGSQKHLVAVRDAFIAIMPVTMAGSIAVLLNALVRDLPPIFGNESIPAAMQWLIGINGNVWWGTIAMLALVFSFSMGYQLAKAYDVNALAGGLVSAASFIIVTPQAATAGLAIGEISSELATILTDAGGAIDGGVLSIGAWGNLNWNYLNSGGLFTAMIVSFFATIIFSKLMRANIIIKLPEQVPPAVSKAFAAIIPGVVAMYACGLVAWLLSTYMGTNVGDLVLEYVQMPFLSLSQGLGSIIIIMLAVSFFWFFGLHGPNVLAPILDGVYKTALLANNTAYEAGTAVADLPYLWTRGSFDAYAWMGGSGCTIALIIAIFIFSKREESRTLAKLSAPMGVFNINEPIIFGLPIVLNPIYIIPWLIVPVVLSVIAYGATAAGLVPPVYIEVPWIVPPVIYAWMATGFSFTAALLALVNLVIAVAIWSVFVIIANRVEIKDEIEG